MHCQLSFILINLLKGGGCNAGILDYSQYATSNQVIALCYLIFRINCLRYLQQVMQ